MVVGWRPEFLGDFSCLPAPTQPRVWRYRGAGPSSPFFFAWGGIADAGRDQARVPTSGDFATRESLLSLGGLRSPRAATGISLARRLRAELTDEWDDATLSVSRTALFDRSRRESDPDRYIDPTEVPYLTLSVGKTFRATGATLGDFATVIHRRTGRLAHAIIGDSRHVIGVEPSLYLSDALNLHRRDEAIYLIFPRTGFGQGVLPTASQIHSRGEALFHHMPDGSPSPWPTILPEFFGLSLVDRSCLRRDDPRPGRG